ncbi:NACHT domain-containing protein, partial [Streptomyces olivaceus]
MNPKKQAKISASETGAAQSQSGGISNTGLMIVNELHQYKESHASQVTEGQIDASVLAYSRRLYESYGRLDLEVLTPLSEQGEHPTVPLREVFVRPYVRADPPPVELPRELVQRLVETGETVEHVNLPPGVKSTQLEQLRKAYKKNPPIDFVDALTDVDCSRVVLLGDPGSGKSTLARYMALALTGEEPAREMTSISGRLPIVIELRRYAEEQWRESTFEAFLNHLHATEGMCVAPEVLAKVLTQGNFVALFDGLDEVFDPSIRKVVSQRISAFAATYSRGRFLVTSRTIGYQRSTLDGAGFKHYMLQDLDERQISEFANLWYANACPDNLGERSQLVRRITDAVTHSRPIKELAGNPLLLTILAIIGRRQSLPRDRQGVYKHAVTVLVAHLDQDVKHLKHSGRGAELIDVLDAEDLHELLRLLARHMQEGRSGIAGNHIHARELEAIIQEYLQQYELPPIQAKACAKALVNRLRERNFILSRYGGEVYGFVHRAFLEYLAAADIVHRYTIDREWSPDELVTQIIGARADKPSWHEVVLLIIGQLNERDAARAIDHLLKQHRVANSSDHGMLSMAIRALAEVRKIGALADQSNRLILHLVQTLSSHKKSTSADIDKAIPALSTFGDFWKGRPLYLRWFHVRGQFADSDELAIRVAAALYTDVALPAILVKHAPRPKVRSIMLQCVLQNWSQLPETLQLIRDRATADPATDVRLAAIRALADHWSQLPETLQLIRDRATADPQENARAGALKALAEKWSELPETLQLIRDRATADPATDVRLAAIRALADHWSQLPETLQLIRDRATADPQENARAGALKALAEKWSELP